MLRFEAMMFDIVCQTLDRAVGEVSNSSLFKTGVAVSAEPPGSAFNVWGAYAGEATTANQDSFKKFVQGAERYPLFLQTLAHVAAGCFPTPDEEQRNMTISMVSYMQRVDMLLRNISSTGACAPRQQQRAW